MPDDVHVLAPLVLEPRKVETQISAVALWHKKAVGLSCVYGS